MICQVMRIVSTFWLSDVDAKKCGTVKAKLDGRFVQVRNVVYWSAVFNRRVKWPTETLDHVRFPFLLLILENDTKHWFNDTWISND